MYSQLSHSSQDGMSLLVIMITMEMRQLRLHILLTRIAGTCQTITTLRYVMLEELLNTLLCE